ncbi:aminotransferase class I/II-fold pyridoxal phosphate-dependent enzyme [Streptomyces marianii]|uniref:Aminotransferase class I/II-fold pyridoxal phosphate-dependent enzyme n=1 Tax=Streptomyces marianii TaxID=1817406 RepID=A0A5R9E4D7_9ACTN|nr:aminotransferase class I/II-fold pyridoxal phosphate-dependent enzyme [Streptomyces marianii]TLQ44818.1 aminotransferase class I/II-fold pyridoxal phosphate-dependent enzyme [Streptomyces marianii]
MPLVGTLRRPARLPVAAGRAALATDLAEVAREMEARRDLAQSVFARTGMKFSPAEGGCFLFADISPLTAGERDCTGFVRDLLDRAGVLLVPGASFFSDPARGEQYVRIAFNRRAETLREAEQRIAAAS